MNEAQYFETVVFSPVGMQTMNPIGIGKVKEVRERNNSGSFQASISLDGDVVFRGDDYAYFRDLSRSDRRYDDVRAVVSIYCNQIKKVLWNTFIDVRKGEFNHDRCEFKCSLSLDNTNRNFENRKGDEFNLLEIVSSRLQTTPQYNPAVRFTNGVPVFMALIGLFRATFTVASVTSDFFGWNSTNPGYTIGHNQLLRNQAFFQKSDIVKAFVTDYSPASILKMSLEECITNLCNLYNLQYTIDAAGNFRIEHVSWFQRGAGLDLTAAKYVQAMKGSRIFTYDEPKIYRVESFESEQAVNLDFVGYSIIYNNALIDNLRGGDSYVPPEGSSAADMLTRRVSWIVDIDAIYGNIGKQELPEPLDPDQDLDGTVLLALDANGEIQKVDNLIETETNPAAPALQRRNNVNSWAILHNDYWKYDRLFDQGMMNNTLQNFVSLQRIKTRKTVAVKMCCDESINVENLVKTEEGFALIKRAARDHYRNILELDLSYLDIPDLNLNAPIANPDVYATNVSTTLNTAAAGKASVLANDIGASSALVQAKATLLGGAVSIQANGHFVYDPVVGMTGTDQFEYIALSPTGRLDIGTVKIIVKTGGIYVHIYCTPFERVNRYAGTSTSILASSWYYRIFVQYFEDPLLQVPFDPTGLNISVPFSWQIKETVSNTVAKFGSGIINPASGTFTKVADDRVSVVRPTNQDFAFTGVITASPQYTVV